MAVFLLGANSTAVPADSAEEITYESASVDITVTSHVAGLPLCYRMSVTPSGRLLSVRRRPVGSFIAGTPAETNARQIKSLIDW